MKNNNFWNKLRNKKKPILALAPMAGFTNSVFRRLCCSYGADVVYSEMASVTALHYYNFKKKFTDIKRRDNGGEATLKLLNFKEKEEKYYVVQIFGAEPTHFSSAARLITEKIKPHGIDINFGCPVGKIIKQGAGADLMKDLKRSREVIKAVLANTKLPVSIKLRLKAGQVHCLDFLKNISDLPIAAVMIHGRSLSQGFTGEPDFSSIKKAKSYFVGPILANGGINNLEKAKQVLDLSQADGLGLARGILGRPWLFQEIKTNQEIDYSLADIFKIIIKQATMLEKESDGDSLVELRKHLVWYVQGQNGASRLRAELVKVNSLMDLKIIFKNYLI